MSKTRSLFFLAAVVLVCVVIQSTLLHFISPDMIVPDLILLVVVFTSAQKGMMKGEILGFGAGLAEDFLTGSFLGFNAFIKTIIGFIFGMMNKRIVFRPLLFSFFFAAAATLLKGVLAICISALFFGSEYHPSVFTFTFLLEILLNSILAPLVFYLLKILKIISYDRWNGR